LSERAAQAPTTTPIPTGAVVPVVPIVPVVGVAAGPPGTHRVFRADLAPAFDPVLFDRAALQRDGRVIAEASAGRGNTVFIDWHGTELVLREYRRGGAARHLSRRHYVNLGLHRSRPMREFGLLCELEARGLPVSRAYAAQRVRFGPLERSMLITRRVPGQTLAARLVASGGVGDEALLSAVGSCLARFHAQGVRHADLNAHNIMVDTGEDEPPVTLIDFDRGRIEDRRIRTLQPPRFALANLQRLARSFERLLEAKTARRVARQVEASWHAAYAILIRSRDPSAAGAATN